MRLIFDEEKYPNSSDGAVEYKTRTEIYKEYKRLKSFKMDIEDKKLYSDKWFSYLQAQICDHFEKIEKDSKSSKKFISTNWSKKTNGGGGTYKILKDGTKFNFRI